jgi:hypothetical protein
MKRNFLMKAFVCLFTVVALCSCKKDNDDDAGSTSTIDNPITAKVENGSNIDVEKVKAEMGRLGYEVGLSDYSDGGFTLKLETSFPKEHLDVIEEIVPDSVTVSAYSVKGAWMDIKAYKSVDNGASSVSVGSFKYATGTSESSWRSRYIVVIDSEVNITGTGTITHDGVAYKETYNVQLKKGWNIVYTKETNNRAIEITSQEPSGLKWYYFPEEEEEEEED